MTARKEGFKDMLSSAGLGFILLVIGVSGVLSGRQIVHSEILGTYVPGNIQSVTGDRGEFIIGIGVLFGMAAVYFFAVSFLCRPRRDR